MMLDAGPYSEQGESRLRARQAVLEGLSESGFLPSDGEHIGFVTETWPPIERKCHRRRQMLLGQRALLLPWEECERSTTRNGFSPRTPSGFCGLVAGGKF